MVSGGIAAALPEMLGRLKLKAIRDRLEGLLDEAVRRDLTLPETLVLLCEACECRPNNPHLCRLKIPQVLLTA